MVKALSAIYYLIKAKLSNKPILEGGEPTKTKTMKFKIWIEEKRKSLTWNFFAGFFYYSILELCITMILGIEIID